MWPFNHLFPWWYLLIVFFAGSFVGYFVFVLLSIAADERHIRKKIK
jgi:hypothetical protein